MFEHVIIYPLFIISFYPSPWVSAEDMATLGSYCYGGLNELIFCAEAEGASNLKPD